MSDPGRVDAALPRQQQCLLQVTQVMQALGREQTNPPSFEVTHLKVKTSFIPNKKLITMTGAEGQYDWIFTEPETLPRLYQLLLNYDVVVDVYK